MESWIDEPYARLHLESDTIGTLTCWRTSGELPPDDSLPNPIKAQIEVSASTELSTRVIPSSPKSDVKHLVSSYSIAPESNVI